MPGFWRPIELSIPCSVSAMRTGRLPERGSGVVESFIGILHLTWSALNAEHDLDRKFSIDSQALLAEVAAKLGQNRAIKDILRTSVGGALEVLRPEAAGG